AVEQNDAFDLVERRLLIAKRCALSIEQDDIAAWRQLRRARRAEIEHRPAPGIDGSAEELGETRPGESDLERRALEVERREARRAERHILLLRMLQDDQLDARVDGRDPGADAERRGLAAARTRPIFSAQCFAFHRACV